VKETVEPVFDIIESVLGFRQFSLRGLKKVTGEWTLVCLAWNLKRMAVLRPRQQESGGIVRFQAKNSQFRPSTRNFLGAVGSSPAGC
jgi:hypothetical protein